jgi:hypothetical protein
VSAAEAVPAAVVEKATGAAVKATGAAVKAGVEKVTGAAVKATGARRKVTAHEAEAEAEAVAAIVQGVGRGGEAAEAWPEMVAVARVGAAAAGVRASTAFQLG